MKSFFLFFTLIFITSNCYAEMSLLDSVTDCGEYIVSGVVRIRPEGMLVVVHEKTRSEQTISLKLEDQSTASVYLDSPMTIGLLLDKAFDGTKGQADHITQKIERRIPNPLFPNKDTGYLLVKKMECKTK